MSIRHDGQNIYLLRLRSSDSKAMPPPCTAVNPSKDDSLRFVRFTCWPAYLDSGKVLQVDRRLTSFARLRIRRAAPPRPGKPFSGAGRAE